MYEYDQSDERMRALGFGPFHIVHDRYTIVAYGSKPKFGDLKDKDICERFILNFWKQFCPQALRLMDIKSLLVHWYSSKILESKWWRDKSVLGE